MIQDLKIKAPFFEIGPKNYLWGDDVVELAKVADEASRKYRVDIIFTTPLTEIRRVKEATKYLHVFAPHMDSLRPGRGLQMLDGVHLGFPLLDGGATGGVENIIRDGFHRRSTGQVGAHKLHAKIRRSGFKGNGDLLSGVKSPAGNGYRGRDSGLILHSQ